LSNDHIPASISTNLAILDGIARSGQLSLVEGSALEKSIQQLALKNDSSANQRTAVSILASSKSDSSKHLALGLLSSTDNALVKAAIATSSTQDTPEFSNWLLERFPSALPEVRQEVFSAIRNNPKRLELMVERLESGKLSPHVLDASQVQSLSGVRDRAIADRLAKILSNSINANRQKVVDEYSKQLTAIDVAPNKNNGKAIFSKNCSACHKLDGVGASVGPDISDSREQSFEKLLISVLDPNRSVDANFFRYLARTEEGIVVEGLLKDSNSQTITLQSLNGAMTTLNRSEIEEFKSSGMSLMPEGIESQISIEEMAELLWYVKNWRYAADKVPANATVKK
jgi:putative heme-binding domain-containing protein